MKPVMLGLLLALPSWAGTLPYKAVVDTNNIATTGQLTWHVTDATGATVYGPFTDTFPTAQNGKPQDIVRYLRQKAQDFQDKDDSPVATWTGPAVPSQVPWANLTGVPTLTNTFNARSGAVVPAANDYSFAQLSGSLACAQHPALTGDITTAAGNCAATLATSGVTAGTYDGVTLDAKGRVTSAVSRVAHVTANSGVTGTTLADTTGLTFAVAANTNYGLHCSLVYQASTTANGLKLALTNTGTTTAILGEVFIYSTATASTAGAITASAGSVSGAAVGTANSNFLAMLDGFVEVGAAGGNLKLQHASIASGTATMQKDSYCRLFKE